jgi:hypothetical protein
MIIISVMEGPNWQLTPQMQQIIEEAVAEVVARHRLEGSMQVVPDNYDSDSTVEEANELRGPVDEDNESRVPEYTGPLTRPPPVVTYNPPPPETPGRPTDNLGHLVPQLSDYQPFSNLGTSQQAARHLQGDDGFATLPREVRRMARERDQASRGRRIRSTQGIGKRTYPRRRGG